MSKARRRQDSMPSASTSTLRMPTASRSSLSHSTILRVVHRRLDDRHDLVEPVPGDDEAADMLGEVARKSHDLVGALDHMPGHRIGLVEAAGTCLLLAELGRRPAPDRAGKRAPDIVGKPHRLGDLAQRRAGAVGHDRGGQRGALLAVFLVDIGHHLLAPLMLEIDVDIGRLVALHRDEALEQRDP